MSSTIRVATRALTVAALSTLAALAGCVDEKGQDQIAKGFTSGMFKPDQPPTILNTELPFRYPPALYARRVQGNVTLRLFVDRDGQVRGDSTRVEESSGYASLDSAAVEGARRLRFVPAKKNGEPVALVILFPVYFRHPEAAPLPGDTVLKKKP